MATVLLVRHGRSTANTAGILAGRTPGVRLDDTGEKQVARTGERIADVPLAAIVSSPLGRCRQTAQAILDRQGPEAKAQELLIDGHLNECDYGDWQNRKLSELAQEEMWKTVVGKPSEAQFPGGESMAQMQERAVEAIRRLDAEIEAEHGPNAVWVAVSHGDIIKAILADAYGMDFDNFQRIHADPASVSIIRYADPYPHVFSANTQEGDLSWLRPKEEKETSGSDNANAAQVGGGAGH